MTDILTTPKKNIILDASTLTSLMSCPRMMDFRYNLNLVPNNGKSNNLEVGSIIHKVLEVYYKNRINGFGHTESVGAGMTAGEMYIMGCPFCTDFTKTHYTEDEHECNDNCKLKPECGHAANEYPGVTNTPAESTTKPSRIGWKWALETCNQYFDYYKNDHWLSLESEVVKGKILYEDDNIRILWKAKLDWLVDTNQGIYPVDHKTAKQSREKVSLNNQFIGQCLVTDSRTMIVNEIGLQTTLKPAEKFKRVPITYSADRLIEWQSETLPYWIYKYLEFSENSYWPPNLTHCENKYGTCTYREVCEADRNMRDQIFKLNFVVGPVWNPEND